MSSHHSEHQPHAHDHTSAHSHEPAIHDPGFSLYASGIGTRLGIALVLCALLWAGVTWALSEVTVS